MFRTTALLDVKPPSPPQHDLEMARCGAETFLKQHVPWQFWMRVHDFFVENNQHEKMIQARKELNLSNKTSYRKALSYHGACRAPPQWADELDASAHYRCPYTQQAYFDPSNAVYKAVFMNCWPEACENLGMSNKATLGDMMEALLGWVYLNTQGRPATMGVYVNKVVEMIEMACVATWMLSD